jgi:cold shock CspA family protein
MAIPDRNGDPEGREDDSLSWTFGQAAGGSAGVEAVTVAAPATRHLRGKMLWFNEEKDHGVITSDEAERLTVEGSAFEDKPPVGRCSGLVVEFDLEDGDDGPRAARVRVVDEPAGRRARRRRAH